ncbi:chorismate-binding protein [Corynebacterium sp.]|uniref:chorismate-binding protein n=1 Tax=Corynebacterium sp. TaxID=1720 RepID=UPI0026DC25FF|nr:chorismate-binding protein [Corynebacterium sp.]MDO5032816.1 chorismate-binding protein [Corynebacterium sp.]
MAFQRLLIVDNHDSFTYNLVDYAQRVTGVEPTVVSNDTPWALVDLSEVDAVIISPGPGSPAVEADLGISADVLREFDGPILGVCLGLQAMVHLDGGTVGPAPRPAHGEPCLVEHDATGLFEGVAQPLRAVRYHSLVATSLPSGYRVTARCEGLIMAVEHTYLPRWAVQFHPESVLTADGEKLIANFLDLAAQYYARQYFCLRTLPGAAEPPALLAQMGPNQVWLDHGRFSIVGEASRLLRYDMANAPVDFFDAANAEFAAHRAPARVGQPIPGCDFTLGWVGYLGYELGQQCGAGPMPQAPGPDAQWAFLDRAVIIDAEEGVSYLLSLAGDDAWGIPEAAAQANTGSTPAASTAAKTSTAATTATAWHTEYRPVHDEDSYLGLIERAQEYMRRGESYEVCLTNRLELDPVPDPLGTYCALRAANPSGRTGYLALGGVALLSTSPELFLFVDRWNVVHSKPIKGTRPRDEDPAADAALRQELVEGEKERSELLMVVDMVRHDLTRACTGVAVPGGFQVASYATVHQLFAEVTGRLREGATPIDAVRAAFPGGSMTGAPKERTMRIISELEGTWRGVYSGAYGFLSLTGTMDLSMTIRSVVTTDTSAYYGVGGAILAVSDPQGEWEETQVKARPLTRLLAGTRECDER